MIIEAPERNTSLVRYPSRPVFDGPVRVGPVRKVAIEVSTERRAVRPGQYGTKSVTGRVSTERKTVRTWSLRYRGQYVTEHEGSVRNRERYCRGQYRPKNGMDGPSTEQRAVHEISGIEDIVK